MRKNNKKGFTIVELVIVIAVIAILAAVLIPTFSGIVTKAKENAALQEAKNEYTNIYALALSSDGVIDDDDDFDANGNKVTDDTTAKIKTVKGTDDSSKTIYTITTDDYTFTFDANGILTGVEGKANDAAKFEYTVAKGVIESAKTKP